MQALVKSTSRVVDLRSRRPEPVVRTKVGTVFLVDSEPDTESFLAWALTSSGISVSSYSCGREFLDALEDNHQGCVLLNLGSPDVDCAMVLESLATRTSPLPAVLYSGTGKALSIVQPLASVAQEVRDQSFGIAVVERVSRAMEIDAEMRSRRSHAEGAKRRLACLTKREMEIAVLVARGKASKVVAFDLDISERTVEIHRAHIMRKTECDSVAELVWLFADAGRPATTAGLTETRLTAPSPNGGEH